MTAITRGVAGSRRRGVRSERTDAVDRAGITAYPDRKSLQPARQLILGVRDKTINGLATVRHRKNLALAEV
jgi:hypothetical protein